MSDQPGTFKRVEGICTCIVAHEDVRFLDRVIKNFLRISPVYVVLSRVAWDGSVGNWERTKEIAEAAGAEVILVDLPSESAHRAYALRVMFSRQYKWCFIPDADELPEDKLLSKLLSMAELGIWDRVAVHMDTYFASTDLVVRPREKLTPILMVNLGTVHHKHIRDYEGGELTVLEPEMGILHHASYVGEPAEIERKISTWGHRTELLDRWFEEIFMPEYRQHDPFARDLHCTHRPAYHMLERIQQPEVFAGCPLRERGVIEIPDPIPTLSFVIPLYGGCEDIRLCLKSLKELGDLAHEIIVVDDRSPDRAAKVAESFEGVRVIRNEKNIGFAGTCNVGYRASSGKVVVFLNSDTIVTRSGTIRLVESLMASRLIGAAGPLTNKASQFQQVSASYTSLDTMPLFADDVAALDVEDELVDMLVGFCIAVKREVLEDVGIWDERFTIGQFEDNDLCYRMRRAGYQLVISKRSFIHHSGSHSLARRKEHQAVLLARNERIYFEKWKDDLECGYVSHLSGMSAEPIAFSPLKRPEEIDKRIRKLAKQAGICLCMIVKNEERVLANCLRSSINGVVQKVVVDTGSTDSTKDILKSFDAEVYDMEWPDSFSIARNVSLSKCRQRWILFLDADDVIDRRSLELILLACIHADPKIGGFIVPVRFVDQGPYGGTQVDHVHVFRALPGIQFEGRIHEQILQSIRDKNLEVVRIADTMIRHAGYDNSPDGQMRKYALHKKLLVMDHQEDPTNPFKMFNPGMEAHHYGDHEEAITWLKMAIEHANPEASIVRKCYSMWGISERALGNVEDSLRVFEKGLQVTPDDPELMFESGRTLTELERPIEALDFYLRINPDTSGHFSSLDTGILTYKRFYNIASLYNSLGNYPKAKEWWSQALNAAPNFSPAADALFDAAMSCGDLPGARQAVEALQRAEGLSEHWANRLCTFSVAMGQPPEATIRGVLQSAPYAVGPLLIFARMLQEQGREAELAPVALELDRLGSAEGAFMRGMQSLRLVDLWGALEHVSRSFELNSTSEPAEKHIAELRRILAEEAAPFPGHGDEVLVGPHCGKLGPATCPHSVVVVTYNSARTIQECAEKALATLGPEDELIVVDNASTDGTQFLLKEIAEQDSRLRLVLEEANHGYAKGANIGLLASHGALLTTLNPDAFVGDGWVEAMSAHLKDGVAAVGPLSDRVGGDQFVGHYLDSRPTLEELPGYVRAEFAGRSEETKLLVGICVMSRRETLDKHGLLEERCELGADDLEFSWRLRMLGLKLAVSLETFVRHEHGVSFSSLSAPERLKKQGRSDAGLARKLQAYYGADLVPDSMEMFDDPIFQDALDRIRLLDKGPCSAS